MPKPRTRKVHTLASLTALCADEGDCLIWPGVGPQRKKVTRPTIHNAGVRQSVRRLFAALRGDPRALAEQAGTAEPGHWSATCGDPHCMAEAHTVRRSPGQHLQAARTRANTGASNQVRIAKIARTQRGRVGKLTDAQIAATFVGTPATSLSNGLMRGFLSEADANATLIPASVPLIGGRPLSSVLPGGTNACPSFSDKDVGPGGVVGWYFYLNFPAQKLDEDTFTTGFADGFE